MATTVAAPWPVLVRERLVVAQDRCDWARRMLAVVVTGLRLPVVADEHAWAEWRVRVRHLYLVLIGTTDDLAYTGITMRAAELLALRGAAPSPTAPLPSVDDIPDAHASVRGALRWLGHARTCAEDAHDAAHRCLERLGAIYTLLPPQGLHGLGNFLNHERVAIHDLLEAAQVRAEVSAAFAHAALEHLDAGLD
ncbi:hypothetical protein U9M48_020841 [Paspalum notatum var. saurae]|uniref:Uncharacterized protein n=1 Tax=Paspalum notatum var. saurae TaxID=547442 RepID=A0AAQ3WSU7_PASNO